MRSVSRSQKGIRNLCSVQIVLSCHLQPLELTLLTCQGFSKFASLWSGHFDFDNVKLVTMKARQSPSSLKT